MPLRLLEITVAADRAAELDELLAEREVPIHSEADAPDGRHVVRLVVPMEGTEALTDALTDRFGGSEAYGVLILRIEAALPVPDEPDEEGGNGTDGPAPEDGAASLKRVSREELYEEVATAARLTPVYVATVGLSTVVAAAGLIRGDVALIIGAMVIAPLLGPTVAFALGLTLGDLSLSRLAARTSAAGVTVALGLALTVGVTLTVDPEVGELARRTRVGLGDVAIAMAAGSAGSLAYTTGLSAAIIGVMVAVALLPPLVAVGLLLGDGHPELAAGSAVLVLVNFTCVSLAAVGTFLLQRIRPRTWWEAEKAKEATRVAVVSWLVLLAVLVVLIFLLD
ncbi:MAG: TIGR00341 family protein [Gemmatimonadota bacterium]